MWPPHPTLAAGSPSFFACSDMTGSAARETDVTRLLAVRILGLFLLAACPGPAASPPPAQPAPSGGGRTGAALCVLSPEDFAAQGLTVGAPQANVSDGGASAYCTYTGKSAAMGGIELDVFETASPHDAEATEATAAGEATQSLQPIQIAGADRARWDPKAKSGGPEFASLLVRSGPLVFVIGIPASADAQQKLTALAGLVLQRLR